MRQIRLQMESLFFSKLLLNLVNVNEEVVGVIHSQKLNAGSIPLPDKTPLFVFM